MSRSFVIQIHTGHGSPHYDLMLEMDRSGPLATWQLPRCPAELEPGQSMPAVQLPDHRRLYLTYSGPVSGDRGQVEPCDSGNYELLEQNGRRWRIHVEGRRLRGDFELTRCDDSSNWRLRRIST